MALYVKKLVIVDEFNEVVYKSTNEKAEIAIKKALAVITNKDKQSKFLSWLDKEFKLFLGFDKNE